MKRPSNAMRRSGANTSIRVDAVDIASVGAGHDELLNCLTIQCLLIFRLCRRGCHLTKATEAAIVESPTVILSLSPTVARPEPIS
jgi:hypothetical protein